MGLTFGATGIAGRIPSIYKGQVWPNSGRKSAPPGPPGLLTPPESPPRYCMHRRPFALPSSMAPSHRIPVKWCCAEWCQKIKAKIRRFWGVDMASCLRETYQERWGSSPLTFLDGLPGARRSSRSEKVCEFGICSQLCLRTFLVFILAPPAPGGPGGGSGLSFP